MGAALSSFSFALLLVTLGCGQKREVSAPEEIGPVEALSEGEPEPPGGDTPSGCDFAVGASCFASLAAACEALGCPRESCSATYSLPSEVSCDR